VIRSRSRRRWLNLGGVAVVAGLLGYALFAQHVQGYEACPLCIFQRVAMLGVGGVLLIAGLHSPLGLGARVYAILGVVAAGIGAAISGRHVYIQNLPPDQVPECAGPRLSARGVSAERGRAHGSDRLGECAEVNWVSSASMPAGYSCGS
jgi:disulfide bond formation protein DsbB